MLYLNLHVGDSFSLDTPQGTVTITNRGLRRSRPEQGVFLGCEAPPEIRIDREEVHLARLAAEAPAS